MNPNPLKNNPKLFPSLAAAVERRAALKAQRKKLVVTNGCFDLLHCGHVSYLQEAAKLGDELWIGLNAAESVRALKGPTRPVQGDDETPRLDAEIRALAPDVYAKAGDYTLETLDAAERAALLDAGTEIRFLPFLPGFSTTSLIAKIAAAARAGTL